MYAVKLEHLFFVVFQCVVQLDLGLSSLDNLVLQVIDLLPQVLLLTAITTLS
jgi:hypothetical protein